MTKQDAISIFGSGAALARALGITRGAVSLWPDVLDQRRADEVRGAAARLGKRFSRTKTTAAAEPINA